jgi:putative hydrolase of the HAD superfamily
MSEIKNIIFDLGGVIINLDTAKTISEFNKLSKLPFEAIYTQLQQSAVFDLFDKGLISESDFFVELKNVTQSSASESELKEAWNAMLLDFPINRLSLLMKLQPQYRLFLLSNTNETHVTEFEKILLETHRYEKLEPFFEKVYYSCRMQMRKPDVEIFDFVLTENGLNAGETLFIDDSPQHVQGALKTGISAYLLPKEKEVEELLKELNLI